jgi:hypothetical protein
MELDHRRNHVSEQKPARTESRKFVCFSLRLGATGGLAFFLFGLSLLHGNRFVLAGTVIALAPLMETTLLTVIIPVRVDSLGRRSFQVITIFLVFRNIFAHAKTGCSAFIGRLAK